MRVAEWRKRSAALVMAVWLSLVLLSPPRIEAERLPIKAYTIADGLAHDRVRNIIRDSRGFLWICTAEGLSRFDGYRFVNYGLEHGLPSATVNDVLETRRGQYWVTTTNGVARFNPAASSGGAGNESIRIVVAPRFTAYPVGDNVQTSNVHVLYEDRTGQLWAGTHGGLFRWEENQGRFNRLEQGLLARPDCAVLTLTEDAEGSLWIGSHLGLIRRLPDGRVLNYTMRWPQSGEGVFTWFVQADREGRLWMCLNKGLLVFRPEPAATAASGALPWRSLTRQPTCVQSLDSRQQTDCGLQTAEFNHPHPAFGIPHLSLAPGEARFYLGTAWGIHDTGQVLHQTSGGQIWIATSTGLFAFDGAAFRHYTTAHGLREHSLVAVNEDSDGNLWFGGLSTGAMKIVRQGFTSFTEADGVGHLRVVGIGEDQTGAVYVRSSNWFISRFDGQRFTAIQPDLPPPMPMAGWNFIQISFQDHAGEWWVPTERGLYRFPKVDRIEQLAHAPPIAVYTTRDGLPDNFIGYCLEDARGDLWLGGRAEVKLTRWERATNTFHPYTTADGLPSLFPASFCLDVKGDLWVGLAEGLARYRAGRFTYWTAADGVPKGTIRSLYSDHTGRLWVGSTLGGLGRIDDPGADAPRFKTYTIADGLTGNNVRCITEDEWGRIYLGVGRGVDRLDPATGQIKHYTTTDGLANSFVNAAFRDRQGHLWFGMLEGLSHLIPEPDRPTPPTPVWINGLRIAGTAYPVSELGVTEISVPALDPNQNLIQVDFFGLSFSAGEPLRYQYKLEGAGQDWSAPTEQRTHEMSLGPGSYRFLVRAARPESRLSPAPASVAFRILPPIWRRWWFLTLAALSAGLLGYALYSYRLARLIALERVRMRIATDLHDDIGASLSRIAILSEVVKQQTGSLNLQTHRALTEIADSARGLVDAMSDIVWSIDPRRDDLKNLVMRVRQFAADVLEVQGVEWDFTVPPRLERIKLAPEQRRHLFLIFKEALNNIARHAHCATAALSVSMTHHQLLAEIRDDGRGLAGQPPNDPATNGRGGNGLRNMQARAAELGGRLEIASAPGQGTRLRLTIPLRK